MRFQTLLSGGLGAAVLLTACGSSSSPPSTSSSSGPSKVASIASEIPAPILALAPFQLAVDATGNVPTSFTDPTTGLPVGSDIDMGNAICKVLGVVCTWNNVVFDDIIAQITGTTPAEIANGDPPRYVFAVSSQSPRVKREAAGVDFVTYYKSGNGWFEKVGGPAMATLTDQCGHSDAVQTGTIQEADDWAFMGKTPSGASIPGATDHCQAAGKPDINVITFASAEAQVAAVLSGRADFGYSSLDFNGYLVKQQPDKLKLVGPICSIGKHAITVIKGSLMEQPLMDAIKYLIDKGYYLPILQKWGLANDAVTSSEVMVNDNSITGQACDGSGG
jgi:polar amino acid transport system substrate-binding protein